jgi:uncharacterized membrane protein YeaQ/YmgE (transglycosylase-associated protein family)
MLLNILLWCLFGLIAGTIAQLIMPGKDPGQAANPMGYVITIVIGILGAALGGYLSSLLFGWDVTGFNLQSFVVAIAGSLLLLVIYRLAANAALSHSHTAKRH